ncbi:MAG: glycine zipper domain-containing protein [Isosphaeraceae bacterium]
MSEKNQRSESNAAKRDENRDPLSGERGAHPVGTGVGAAAGGLAAGAATGAAVGTAAGPIGTAVGTAVGAAIGAVTGGLAGKAVAEHIDPTVEHEYWRSNYGKRSYVRAGEDYDQYAPAYQYGWESQAQHHGKDFDEVESHLERDWNRVRGNSKLGWAHAKGAVRDSWERMSHRTHGV